MATHYAHVETSPRLQTTLNALSRAGQKGMTTRELLLACSSVAVHSDISELRLNGYLISCQDEGFNANRRKVFRYRLEGRKFE